MEKIKQNPRTKYLFLFTILLITEILIARYVRDSFIRPYGGDILVTILICCFARIFIPTGMPTLPLWVFLFAAAIEAGQYFGILSLLGLNDNTFLRTLLGSTFSIADLLCYATGCFLFFLTEFHPSASQTAENRRGGDGG